MKFTSSFFCIPAVLIAVLFAVTPVLEAGTTGKISGIILDAESNDPLPGVNVLIEGTTLGAATNTDGEYFILNIPPGVYTITTSFVGYQTITSEEVMVMTDRTTTLDLTMQSAALTGEEVIVTATRPAVIRDLTASSDFIPEEVVENLPFHGIKQIMDLTPGLRRNGLNKIVIRGSEEDMYKFYVDGAEVGQESMVSEGGRTNQEWNANFMHDYNMLGVQEMEVITGGFNAEYGNAQSGVINVISKEGTRRFTGEVRFEYGPPSKKHFGHDMYDPNEMEDWDLWGSLDKWDTWWSGLSAEDQQEVINANGTPPDGMPVWENLYYRWVANHTPNVYNGPGTFLNENGVWEPLGGRAHWGGAYDYTKLNSLNFQYGIGGPMWGDKITFYIAGVWRRTPTTITSHSRFFKYSNTDASATYRINPNMKLRFKWVRYYQQGARRMGESPDQGEGHSWQADRARYQPRQNSYHERFINHPSLHWTHTLSPSTFYEVVLQYRREVFETPMTDRGQPEASYWWLRFPAKFKSGWWRVSESIGSNWRINSQDINGGTETGDGRLNNFIGRFDLTSQVTPNHQLKLGLYSKIVSGKWWAAYTDHGYGMYVKGLTYTIGWQIKFPLNQPFYHAVYIQDKMEYGQMVANVGLRLEYMGSDASHGPQNWFEPYIDYEGIQNYPYEFRNAPAHARLSPRVGFSHPISENTAFRFMYGHFYQQPTIDKTHSRNLHSHVYSWFYDPSISPGKTVSYEFGIQHNLKQTHRINLVGYINEMSDQFKTISYRTPAGRRGNLSSSNDSGYANSKGVELTIEKTSVGLWYYKMSYTLSRAFSGYTGPSRFYEDPTDPRNFRHSNVTSNLRGTDRTHMLSAILALRMPGKFGPVFGEFHPLQNVTVTATYRLESGKPYTYNYTQAEQDAGLRNNRRYPLESRMDVQIRKAFSMFGIRPMVWFRAVNLFNNRHIWNTEGATGIRDWTKRNITMGDPRFRNHWRRWFKEYVNQPRQYFVGIGFQL